MSEETIFPKGMIFKRPKEGVAEFVKGHISIKCAEFVEFMREHKKADGWMNIDLLLSREGKLYLKLNTWQPTKKEEPVNGSEAHSKAIDDAFDRPPVTKSDVPF